VAVYKFAHEMQMSTLMEATEYHLKKVATPADILEVMDFYKFTENEAALKNCWEVNLVFIVV